MALTRAERRYRKERKKKYAERIVAECWQYDGSNHDDPHWISKLAENMKNCSCDMCRNPRRAMGTKTRQEKSQDEIEQIESREQARSDTKNG